MSVLAASNSFSRLRQPGACAGAALVLQLALAGAAMAAAPEAGLPMAAPETVGVDSAPLVRMSQWIRQENLDVRSFLIIKDGKLIYERYSKGLTRNHNYELYSITKNVTALAAGVLVDEGRSHLDEKVATVLARVRPDLKPALADKGAIELRHVLSMSTGLVYNFKPSDDPIYYGAPDRLKLAAETTPKRPPGQEFDYTDVNPILASAVLGADAGMPLQDFAAQKLFKPMGMTHYAWERADDKGLVSAGWGLRLRAVDMAKVGMLALSGGRWEGRQLVSQSWMRTMTAPSSAPFYGFYWWLNDIVATEPEVHAMGFKGQFIVALPERNAVVVMTSMLPIEGDLAAQHQGQPGAPADPTDTPKL
ncbi:MAG: serine hydrolase [Polaromonas sp.]|nr:serine hydrolase [Polaromonas sp.]